MQSFKPQTPYGKYVIMERVFKKSMTEAYKINFLWLFYSMNIKLLKALKVIIWGHLKQFWFY